MPVDLPRYFPDEPDSVQTITVEKFVIPVFAGKENAEEQEEFNVELSFVFRGDEDSRNFKFYLETVDLSDCPDDLIDEVEKEIEIWLKSHGFGMGGVEVIK
jgi:hypothetical protein